MSKLRPALLGNTQSMGVSAWPLRSKVALAIAIPLLLAATLGLLQVRSDLTDASNAASSAHQVTVLRPAVAYLTAAERAMVAAQDTSSASDADLKAAVKDVQAAGAELMKTRDTAHLTADQRYQIDAMMDLSSAIRNADTATLSPGTWVAQLRQLQSGTSQLIASIANAQTNPEPRLELLAETLNGRFSLSMQQALAATEATGGTSSLELYSELGVEGAAIDQLASTMGDSEPAIAALRTENAQRTHAVRTGGADLGGSAAYTEYDSLISSLMDGIDQQLAQSASDGRRSALVSGGIVFGALLATILLAVLVSRLLLNPIRKVREGARTVAIQQLPQAVARIRAGEDPGPIEPIDVTTHEEVGQLARAVDDLHRQAVTLASGEARVRAQVSEMFITLSRRNTSLINQQLSLIETLEKDEEDPQRLESLFRLDHLAARMRRTADSLLVLADAPTHTSADDDLTVASALQAATAGVQDYRRVRVGSASTAHIKDEAAADVVHILTELVDNALAYSAPTTTVLVSSTGNPIGVTIEIEDSGLGIPNLTLAELNGTLRTGAEVTPDTARRMGLFVVSRLAQRHGITVMLRRNRNDGITAAVLLPSGMLEVVERPEPTIPAARTVEPPPPFTPPPAPQTNGVEPPSLEERLNAAIGVGLPRRQPGAQVPATTTLASVPDPEPTLRPSVEPAAAATEPPASRPFEPVAVAAVATNGTRPAESADGADAHESEPDHTDVDHADADHAEADELEHAQADYADYADRADGDALAVDDADADHVDVGDLEVEQSASEESEEPDESEDADVEEPAVAESEAESEDEPAIAAPAAVVRTHERWTDPLPVRPSRELNGQESGSPLTAAAYVAASDTPSLRAVSSDQPGEGQSFPPPADAEAERETPIFTALRSAWLSANATTSSWGYSEVEAGWAQADAVAAKPKNIPMSDAGLPMRRPGTRLVPGGVTKPAKVGARDPDAIRERLAAHASGVSRGRAAAATAQHERSEESPA